MMKDRSSRARKPLFIATVTFIAASGFADHDFYGGDPDGRGWLASQGPSETGPIVFEDARLTFQGV